jgi:hypothetical protein
VVLVLAGGLVVVYFEVRGVIWGFGLVFAMCLYRPSSVGIYFILILLLLPIMLLPPSLCLPPWHHLSLLRILIAYGGFPS